MSFYLVQDDGVTKTLFNRYSEGSCFNIINSINGHESLFMIETNEKSIIFKLPAEQIMKI